MNSRELLNALTDIDDDLIADADKKPSRINPLRWVAAVAACVVLLSAVGGVWAHQRRLPTGDTDFVATQMSSGLFADDADSVQTAAPIVYPTENEPCNNASAMACWVYTPPFTLKALADKTTHIVLADVIEEHREPYENYTAYFVTLKIHAVFKGSLTVGDEILYADNGVIMHYETGHKGRTHCGGPLLEKGNRVVLFMTDKDNTRFPTPVGGEAVYRYSDASISKFFLDADGKYHASGTYSHAYQTYGWTDMPHDLTDYTPKTLDEMILLIGEEE